MFVDQVGVREQLRVDEVDTRLCAFSLLIEPGRLVDGEIEARQQVQQRPAFVADRSFQILTDRRK